MKSLLRWGAHAPSRADAGALAGMNFMNTQKAKSVLASAKYLFNVSSQQLESRYGGEGFLSSSSEERGG
jgi:hypothetical protein